MCKRFLVSLGALAIVVAVGSLAAVSAAGQTRAAGATKKTAATETWTSPRTPDGQPDLQGVWLSNSATPLERPKALEGKSLLSDEEVTELKQRADRLFTNGNSDFAAADNVFLAALENRDRYTNPRATALSEVMDRKFDNRTSLVVDPPDGKIPPLTSEARQRRIAAESATQQLPAGPEDLSDALRCIAWGVPRLGGRYGAGDLSYYQILQGPGYVVLYAEVGHEARIIPLDGRPHLSQSLRQWNGDSRGHWEKETLVVDTSNFSPKSHPTGPFSAISNLMEPNANLHVVERFTRVGPNAITYEMTFDDPTTWTTSWTAMMPLNRITQQLYEYACHEGNEHVVHTILAGARAEEKAAEERGDGPK